eukprot:2807416-Rhodomonas_salina.3
MAASIAVGSFLVVLVCKLLTLMLERVWPSIVRPPGVQSVIDLAVRIEEIGGEIRDGVSEKLVVGVLTGHFGID